MARTKLNDGQLEKIVNSDKVSGASLNITGSDVSALTSLTGGDHFLVQSGSAVPKKITADTMQDFFSKTDIRETGDSASYQLVFADDDNEYNADNASSYSSFQTSRLQESSVTSATTSLTFSPEYGASAAAGLAVIFTDSSSNKIAFTFDSVVSSGDTSVAVTYNAGLSNATSMSKSSISSVTSVSKGSGDGNLRVDGSDLTYNPSTNLLTVGGDISVGDDILMASDGAVLSLGAGADVTLTHDGSNGAAIASAGAFDIDAAGALTLDGASITIGGDSDVAVDFDSSTFDLDASGAITIDGTSTLSLDAADDTNLSMAANDSSSKTLTIGASNSGSGSGLIDVNADGAITVDSSGAGVSIDGAAASNFSTSAGDLTLEAGGSSNKVVIKGDHSSGVAIHLDANEGSSSEIHMEAGVIDMDASGAATLDAGGSITLTGAGVLLAGGSSEVDITTSGAFDVNVGSVDLDSSAGVAIDGTVLSFDGTDDSNLTVTASGKDLDIAVAGGSTQELRLASAGTGASALHLNASAGSVDIDSADNITMDAADDIALTTTSADGLITLHSAHTAGQAILIDANAAAGSILDVDAGIMDVDVQGAYNLDAGGAIGITGAGVDVNAGSGTLELTSSGAVDVNGAAITVDGTSVSLDASDDSNFSVAGNSSSAVTLTLAASNSGSGAGNMALSADTVTITGNLDVNGTTTTIDTTSVAISDHNIILDRDNSTSAVVDGCGLTMEGGSGDDITLQQLSSGDRLELKKGSSYHGIAVGKLMIDGASDYLDVSTDLQIVAAADILLDPGGGDVKVDGNLLPNADDTSDLGSTSAAWQDLHLEGDVLMTDAGKVETAAGALTLSAAGSSQKVIIDAAGDIDLNADSGQIVMKDDSATLFTFAANEIDVASGDLTLDVAGDIILDAAGAQVKPGSNDQAALGDSSTRWSDLFMADGSVLNMGTSASAATLTHSQSDIFGSDIKDDRLTSSFSAFQVSRIVGSTLSSSTSTISMSPEVGTSIGSGTTIVFTAGSDTIAYDVSSSVSSGDSSFTVSYNAGASSATSVSVSGISNTSKDHGTVKAAIQESSITSSTSAISFADADSASAFNSKIGANGTLKISVSGGSATFTLASYSSGTSISLASSPTMDTVSSASPSSATAFEVKSTSKSNKLTLDGASASLNIQDHDGSSYGLELAGTLVSATAAELNIMDGDTTAASVTLVAGDGVVLNDGGTMKQALVSDFGTFMAGTGVQVSSGVLSVECVTDIATSATRGSVLSSDLKTGSLSQNMVSGSLQVFLNGMLQTQSGSVEGTPDGGSQGAVYDYHLLTDTGPPKIRFEEALDGDDVLQLRYIKA